jgi:long-chain acyl-CoA synthetase
MAKIQQASEQVIEETTVNPSRPWLRFYQDAVPASIKYPDVPLHGLLEDSATRYPLRPALVFFDRTINYKELNAAADRFANGLIRLGLRKGDRVALVLPNCPQFVIAFYGTLKAGGVVVPTNPLYTERELEFQLKDAGASIAVTLTKFYPALQAVRERVGLTHLVVTNIKEYFSPVVRVMFGLAKEKQDGHRVPVAWNGTTHPFAKLATDMSAPGRPEVSPDDLAVLQYTGGTTGTAKGAMLLHRNLVANAIQVRTWDVDAKDGQDVVLTVLPLFHVYALTVAMNRGLYAGAMLVLLPRYAQHELLAAIRKYRPTIFPGVPTLYNGILSAPDLAKYDLSSIRACISGSSTLPLAIQERFEAATGGTMVEGYGLSEASPVTHCNRFYSKRKPGSIGIPFPDTDARIVDLTTGEQEMPPGEPGELLIRGPQVMKGYWNRPDESGAALDGGWLHTGDIACRDEDGFFYIVDRKKDMIIVGGFNVYPRDIEEVLFQHPKVADAAAVGLPDEYKGEQVKAYIVLRPGEEATNGEIMQHCIKYLAPYKVPSLIEFRTSLPKTVVGKVVRRVLVEEELSKQSRPDNC